MKDAKIDLSEVELWAKFQAERSGTIYHGRGEFFDTDFTYSDGWDNAVTRVAYLNHRIPELHAWLYYQYKKSADGRAVDVRTNMYKMTTRPIDKPWYRGNLNLEFHNFSVARDIPSPDAMWQEVQPSEFIAYVRYGSIPVQSANIQFRIACNFDGTHNDGWEHSSWEVFPINAVQGDEVVDERLGNPRIVVERFFEERKNKQGE